MGLIDRDSYTEERQNNYTKSILVDEFIQPHFSGAVKKNGNPL